MAPYFLGEPFCSLRRARLHRSRGGASFLCCEDDYIFGRLSDVVFFRYGNCYVPFRRSYLTDPLHNWWCHGMCLGFAIGALFLLGGDASNPRVIYPTSSARYCSRLSSGVITNCSSA